MRIGFVGAGLMGAGMVRCLADAGHEVHLYARTPAKARDLPAVVAPSIAEAVSGAELACSCVTDSDDVAQVVAALLTAERPPPILVELSTISPAVARDLAVACAAKGIAYLDCPVSGGPAAAASGTLAIMCGGDADTLAAAAPALDAMGDPAKRFHCGPVGTGLVVKLVNNLLAAVAVAASAEALGIGQRAGVDPALLREVIMTSSGANWQLEHRFPVLLAGNLAPGFKTSDLRKDVGHARDLAGEPLPIADLMAALYAEVDPHLDFGAIAARSLDLPTEG